MHNEHFGMTTKWVRAAAALGLLYAARRYYRNWGTTKDECQIELPGDELVKQPATRTTEGITVDASAEAVWQALMQRFDPDAEGLKPGEVIRIDPYGWWRLPRNMVLTVERVVDGSAVILRGAPPQFPWRTVISLHVLPRLQDQARLLVRNRTELRRPGEVLLIESTGPIVAFATRRLLLDIKRCAEQSPESQTAVNVRSGCEPNMKRLPVTLTGRMRT
ncbi:hypothetical protein MAGR_17480 [Mycolicibacterium agri]|uniref:Uncharacterized protein n=2 Tax=Mycolicibacterium agri TaxID=36811 RepID=A0A7I9VZ30_MYCAG|nr:hypothetical protein MAGR_17480 [Mycolicibacterium agri]